MAYKTFLISTKTTSQALVVEPQYKHTVGNIGSNFLCK